MRLIIIQQALESLIVMKHIHQVYFSDKVIKNNIKMIKGSDAHSAKDVGKGF